MCQPITGRCCTSVCHLLNYLLISNAKFLFLPFRLVTTFPWVWQLSCENYWCLDIRDLSRNSRFTEFGILTEMSCCKSAQMTETSFTILSHLKTNIKNIIEFNVRLLVRSSRTNAVLRWYHTFSFVFRSPTVHNVYKTSVYLLGFKFSTWKSSFRCKKQNSVHIYFF